VFPRDLGAEGTFVISPEGLAEAPGRLDTSMRSASVLASPWRTRCGAIAAGGQAKEIGNAYSYKEAQDPNLPE
jgi:hypothetical protein